MSRQPEVPEHLRALAPGYTLRQIELDAEMVALGRPVLSLRMALDPKLLAEHNAALEAWGYANSEASGRWLELRSLARAEDARLFEERYGPEAFARERMRVAGFPEELTGKAMRELRDNACFGAARDWARDGATWCLVLSGDPGCGKTQAATWAAYQLLTRNHFAPRCVQCLKVSEGSLYGGEAEEYRWRCTQAGTLVLDDLGEGEQRHEKRSVWRGWVDGVLTERHAAKRRTIITTNRTIDELAEWLGVRLADRLDEGVLFSTGEKSMRGTNQQAMAT